MTLYILTTRNYLKVKSKTKGNKLQQRRTRARARSLFVDLIVRESIEAYSAVCSLFVSYTYKQNNEKGESHESVYKTATQHTIQPCKECLYTDITIKPAAYQTHVAYYLRIFRATRCLKRYVQTYIIHMKTKFTVHRPVMSSSRPFKTYLYAL